MLASLVRLLGGAVGGVHDVDDHEAEDAHGLRRLLPRVRDEPHVERRVGALKNMGSGL